MIEFINEAFRVLGAVVIGFGTGSVIYNLILRKVFIKWGWI